MSGSVEDKWCSFGVLGMTIEISTWEMSESYLIEVDAAVEIWCLGYGIWGRYAVKDLRTWA